MRIFLSLLVLALLIPTLALAAPITTDNFLRVYDAVVHLNGIEDLQTLKPLYLTITGRDGLDLTIMASREEIDYLRAAGWRVDVSGRNDGPVDATGYHTYDTCLTELQGIVTSYPAIASLSSIATTVNGRGVWALKISDNVDTSEAEPALIFDWTIHGDEQIAMEVGMAWIHELVDNYGSDGQITDLVNDMEIYVVPMTNPDGVASVSRYNGNGTDMNRNYPFWWEGSSAWTPENETVGVMNLGMAENFVLGINAHSGAEIINYCWDGIHTLSPDDDLESMISDVYAAQSGYPTTNGAAWYVADGTTEDWYHGSLGALAVIVEISNTKMPPAAQIQGYIDMNLPSLRDWSEVARMGIWGTVTDDSTDDPLEAAVFVGDRLPVLSDPDLGDFYRVLEEGTYDLAVWANGYGWKIVSDVAVPATGHLDLDIEMTASKVEHAAIRCVINMRKDPNDNPPNHTWPKAALGGANGDAFSLGVNGWAVFDMGANTPVSCGAGDFLYVVEDGDDEGYSVKVAQDWTGPYELLGDGTGSDYFDLSTVSFDEIRYVYIKDDGDGNNWIATPGADIDAIHVNDAPVDDDVVDDDTVDDDVIDDDTVDDDVVDDDVVDDDVVDDDVVDDDVVDDDVVDDDVVDDDVVDDDVVDDDVVDDDVADDDIADDDLIDDDATDDDLADDDAAPDDDDNGNGCGCS